MKMLPSLPGAKNVCIILKIMGKTRSLAVLTVFIRTNTKMISASLVTNL